MTKHLLPNVEFYITNVCNLNCSNCNRLNNYRFSGHQIWKDHQAVYEAWGKRLEISRMNILGGEPFLNSSLGEWMSGLRRIWPAAEITVLTNGTRLSYFPNLYDALLKDRIRLTITTHNRARHEEIKTYVVEELLQHPITKKINGNDINWVTSAYDKVKDPSWPDCNNIDDFYLLPEHIQKECKEQHGIDPDSFLQNTSGVVYTDTNGVKITLEYAEDFVTAPLQYIGDSRFKVYDSDPKKAHNSCISKLCHHFDKGKLYKCHHVALLPEFIKQFDVDIDQERYDLLHQYSPAQIDFTDENLDSFLENLPNKIPQCRLCPEKLESHAFQSDFKKIKIIKKPTVITKVDQ